MRWARVLNSSPPRPLQAVRQQPRKLLKQLSSWRQTVPVSFTAQNLPWMEGELPSEQQSADSDCSLRRYQRDVRMESRINDELLGSRSSARLRASPRPVCARVPEDHRQYYPPRRGLIFEVAISWPTSRASPTANWTAGRPLGSKRCICQIDHLSAEAHRREG